MEHILDYRGFIIFKQANNEYVVKIDTPDGIIPVGPIHRTCLEAIMSLNCGLQRVSPSHKKPPRICQFFIDFFNISA